MSTGAQDSPVTDGLSRALVPVLALLFAGGLALSVVQLRHNHEILIERTAIQHAAVYADTLDRMRELYATEVVETARKTNIRITHDYLTEPNAIPLPITLSRKLEENPPMGVVTRMYSPFPFEFPEQQASGGLRDQFARDAWNAFNVPEAERPQSFARVEDQNGIKTLRYAIAEPMKEQCVSCHNDYAGSPKTDWNVGDVRGVLEVAYPLDQAAELAESSIWETLGTLTPMLMLALLLMGLATREQRRSSEALRNRIRAQQEAQRTRAENDDLRSRIDRQTSALLASRLEVLGNDKRLFQVLESMPLGVLVLDSEGNTKYANDNAVQLLGDEGVVDGVWVDGGRRADVAFHVAGEDEPCRFSDLPIASALRGRPARATDLELRTGETRIPVLLSAAPIFDASGHVSFAIMAIQDITDEKVLEQQARQAQRMNAVGRLAGGVAHDFNNLLTAIQGFTSFALEELDESSTESADLQQVMGSAARGKSLTSQLLAFSRQHSINPHVIETNAAVSSIQQMLDRLISKKVELETRLDKVANVKLPEGALDQVLINLAVNASDAMPDGGTLTIATSMVELDDVVIRRGGMGIASGHYVCITVRDTGTGMDEETLRQIFDPFYTTKGAGKGTGLGLSTCWGIARQADGHIEVESVVGQGTTIRVYLPGVHEAASEEAEGYKSRAPHADATVLVVEDDPVVRAIAVRRLTREGYRVSEAADGVEALEFCDSMPSGSIDLLLTDVVMPRMNGTELVKRATPRHPTMRVLYMSGYTDDKILQHGVQQAGVELLQKPFTPDELAAKTAQVLDSSDEGQPHV